MDRRVDERFRKPRRAKGTPFHAQRNYYAAAALGISGLTWVLFEYWPAAQRLKQSIKDGKFDDSAEVKHRRQEIRLQLVAPSTAALVQQIHKDEWERRERDERGGRPEPWYAKIYKARVELYEDMDKKYSKISKYFSKQSDSQQTSTSSSESSLSVDLQDVESPYRHLTNVKAVALNDTLEDEANFTEKPLPKTVKLFPPKTQKSKRKSPQKKRFVRGKNQSTILRLTKDNFNNLHSDVNSDHLQLALALSKSTYESTCQEKSEEGGLECLHLRSLSKKVETTLDKFGFKSTKPKMEPSLKKFVMGSNAQTKRKKSKYTYVTPILFIRTNEDRESLISSKISLILSKSSVPPKNNTVDLSLNSQRLERWRSEQNRIFDTDSIYNKGEFYVKSLNIPRECVECGRLLKKWENIAGRDKSPERYKSSSNTPESLEIVSIDKKVDRCISPDLFQSDSEPEVSPVVKSSKIKEENFETPTNSDDEILSQSILTPIKKSPKKTTPKKISFINVSSQISTCLDFEPITVDLTNSDDEVHEKNKENSLNCTENDYNCTAPLNVTDYINEMLTQNAKNEEESSSNVNCEHMDELCLKPSRENLNNSSSNDPDELCLDTSKKSSSKPHFSCENSPKKNHSSSNDTSDHMDELYLSSSNLKLSGGNLKNCNSNDPDVLCLNTSERFSKVPNTSHFSGENSPKKNRSSSNDTNDHMDELYLSGSSSKPSGGNLKNSSSNGPNVLCLNTSERFLKVPNTSHFSGENSPKKNRSSSNDTSDHMDELYLGSSSSNPSGKNLKNSSSNGPNEVPNSCHFSPGNSPKKYRSSSSSEHMDELCLSTENSTPKSSDKVVDFFEGISPRRSQDSSRNSQEISSSQGSEISMSQESQKSIAISDEELNYSSVMHNRSLNVKTKAYYELEEFEEDYLMEEKEVRSHFEESGSNIDPIADNTDVNSSPILPHKRIVELKTQNVSSAKQNLASTSFLNESSSKSETVNIIEDNIEKTTESNTTPQKNDRILTDKTPDDNLVIKTKNVTPMPDYDQMDTPKVERELQKYGVKSLKRQRGVKLLKYLYECTHPEIDKLPTQEKIVVKKRKKGKDIVREIRAIEVGNETKDFDFPESDLIFESRRSSKVAGCRIPLQIVWHNFLACNKEIAENILLYEPIQLEVIHSMLKEQGFKFRIQDLQTFLDKKCITIRAGNGTLHR